MASCTSRRRVRRARIVNDVQAIVDISQQVGIEIEVLCFIGISPIRQYAEDWDLARMMQAVGERDRSGRKYNLPVAYVTEDTTRSAARSADQAVHATRSSTARSA